jgi:hypothetical protein
VRSDSGGADGSAGALPNPLRNLTFQAGQESTRRDARSRPYPRQQAGCLPGMKAMLVVKHFPGWAPVGQELFCVTIQSANFLIDTWLSTP